MGFVKQWSGTWGNIVILLVLSMLTVACQTGGTDAPADVEPCKKQAIVDSVKVEEREGEYYAIVSGTYTDICTKTETVMQKVEGEAIHVSVCTTRPEDVLCAQVLAPYEEEILLDTRGLTPGEYEVNANGVTATFSIH